MKTTTAQGKNISQRAKIMAPHTTREQILKCFCSNCYYFLPINYNWVWWSLIFVSTWLLLTASTSKRKTKGSTLVFNTMLQTFNTTNRKFQNNIKALYILFHFALEQTFFYWNTCTSPHGSWVHDTFLDFCPGLRIQWAGVKKNLQCYHTTIKTLWSFWVGIFFKWRINENEVTFSLLHSGLVQEDKLSPA